jgi:hypothetical protein
MACRALVAPGADVTLFYFAGHGFEATEDVILGCSDGTSTNPGIRLSEFMAEVQKSSVAEAVIILDCCFSGGAGGVPQLGTNVSVLRRGVSILTASREDQTSVETAAGRGLFSTYLCGALDGGAADVLGKVTVAGLYAYLSESFSPWQQRPSFKSNIDRTSPLRNCEPAVPLENLRELPSLFPSLDHYFPLDASYEPDACPSNAEHERIFGLLQRCRAAKLVEPVDSPHMYFAAMENKGCRLTPLGRHYCHMATEGLL